MPKVLFDCDTGIDDSLALLYLLAHPEVTLLAVLSTAGNVPAQQVSQNNLGWLELVGRDDLEVCLGADAPLATPLMTTEDTHGPLGVGYAELPTPRRAESHRTAAQAWSEITRAHPGEVVGLVTGPATNLALAIRGDPGIPARLRRLVLMGGAFHHAGNTTPTSEWNVAVDPEAWHEVLHAYEELAGTGVALPILCPLDLTETVEMTPDHLLRLADAAGSTPAEALSADDPDGGRSVASNPLVRAFTDAVRFYFEFHREHDSGYIAHMHDPFAAAVAVDPTVATLLDAPVDVELTGSLTRGTTVADHRHMWGRPDNARIAVATDPAAFFDRMIDTVGGYARDLA
ncbi:nucleoside hydrolase [Tsukamurella soli]|uniref:Nucleoside hydrolase n=1 Tax=Tsukamurella soli TaxID=644556 RepID=A0ABP8KE40_9ACTN